MVRGGRVKVAATLATHRGARGRRSCRTATLRCQLLLTDVELRIGSKRLMFLKALHLGSTIKPYFVVLA